TPSPGRTANNSRRSFAGATHRVNVAGCRLAARLHTPPCVYARCVGTARRRVRRATLKLIGPSRRRNEHVPTALGPRVALSSLTPHTEALEDWRACRGQPGDAVNSRGRAGRESRRTMLHSCEAPWQICLPAPLVSKAKNPRPV